MNDAPSSANAAQKILFFGNCQMAWLRANFYLAADSAGMKEGYQFVHVNAPGQDALSNLAAQLPGASALLFQITRDMPEPPRDIADIAHGRIFRFPTLLLKSFWPFDGFDPRNRTNDPDFISGFCPRGDEYVNRLLRNATSADEIFRRYMQDDLAKLLDLSRLFELEIARFRLQERSSDLKFADAIASEYRDQQHFAMVWHPTHALYLRFIEQIWAFLDLPPLMRDRSRFVLERGNGMQPHIPVHPSVAEHFGLNWAKGDPYFDYFGYPMKFADWLRAYIHHRPWPKGR